MAIKYVCISDLHLGEEDSLLTALSEDKTGTDTMKTSPVMRRLGECLGELITQVNGDEEKPTLILNGDILEMALCLTHDAIMTFDRFIETVMPEGGELFDRFIFIPGNHDHHMWELARETQYVEHIKNIDPDVKLEEPWHTSSLFENKQSVLPKSYLLGNLVRRFDHLKNENRENEFKVTVAYPSFGLVDEKNSSYRCVIFDHGHYIEPIYQLMSNLRSELFPDRKKPVKIWEIEKENFAWIDFFWSTLGRSGGTGEDMEMVYEKLQTVKGQEELCDHLAQFIAKHIGWGLTDPAERLILKRFLPGKLKDLGLLEKQQGKKLLSDKCTEGLKDYMGSPIAHHIQNENLIIPDQVSFVFGHTHKPFADTYRFTGYKGQVNVYNTGGWIVESTSRVKKRGGSIILVDENLATVSVRMYNETVNERPDEVRVDKLTQNNPSDKEFLATIEEAIKKRPSIWWDFSTDAYDEIKIRAENLATRRNEPV